MSFIKIFYRTIPGDIEETSKKCTFFDIFPTTVSTIDLSYENTDAIEEYTVEFQVQYWEPGAYTKDNAKLITSNSKV